jgi:hypothetical protein
VAWCLGYGRTVCGAPSKTAQFRLIEAAKLNPRWNPELAVLHERELARGNRNRATLAVARKLLAYLMAVDRSGKPFRPRGSAVESASDEPSHEFRPVLAGLGDYAGE